MEYINSIAVEMSTGEEEIDERNPEEYEDFSNGAIEE